MVDKNVHNSKDNDTLAWFTLDEETSLSVRFGRNENIGGNPPKKCQYKILRTRYILRIPHRTLFTSV